MNTSLEHKIDYSLNLIRRAESTALKYRPEGFFVAFSGGKDSQVLLKLTELSGVKFTAEHRLTTIDAPENVLFIKRHYPNVRIVRPPLSFYRLCLKYRMLPTSRMTFCCHDQKEKVNAHSVTLTGVRRAESSRRASRQEVYLQTRRRHPQFTQGTMDELSKYQEIVVDCLQGKDKLVINPILYWSDEDVWEFIHDYNLPINPLYKRGYTRVGCLFCPLSNFAHVKREVADYPKYYQAFIRLISRIRKANIDYYGTDYFADLTDEDVFWGWAKKQSVEKTRQQKQSNTFIY